jgi:prolyl oligopeptidase
MAAKLIAQGHRVYFHEPVEGGHSAGADLAQMAFNVALGFAFLRKTVAGRERRLRADPATS